MFVARQLVVVCVLRNPYNPDSLIQASAIFTKYPPRDPPMAATLKCPHSGCSANNLHELSCELSRIVISTYATAGSCAVCHQPTSWCVATGEPIFSESKNTRLGPESLGDFRWDECHLIRFWRCRRHQALLVPSLRVSLLLTQVLINALVPRHETVIGEGIEMTICALCHAPVV